MPQAERYMHYDHCLVCDGSTEHTYDNHHDQYLCDECYPFGPMSMLCDNCDSIPAAHRVHSSSGEAFACPRCSSISSLH